MFIIAGALALLALLGLYFSKKQGVHQRAETARLLSVLCGVLAVLFGIGGVLGWGSA